MARRKSVAQSHRGSNRSNRTRMDNPPLEQITVGVDFPPDRIFKFKRARQMVNKAAQEVMYLPYKAEYIEGEGNFVYYRGVGDRPAPLFPSRTVAPWEAINATNGVKRVTINIFRLLSQKEMIFPLVSLIIMGKKWRAKLLTKTCEQYNHIVDMLAGAFLLEDGYYCNFSKETRGFVHVLLEQLGVHHDIAWKTSEAVAIMFEYDNAYRFRLQDIMTEANFEELVKDFPKETKRLLVLEEERERIAVNDVTDKFRSAIRVLTLAWKIPILKKAIRKGIESINQDKIVMDEADVYHSLLYGDYDVAGKNLEERFKIYENYHGTDKNKWPAQIIVTNPQ